MRIRKSDVALIITLLCSWACGTDFTTGIQVPGAGEPGIRFTGGAAAFVADGGLTATSTSGVLAREFAVARADSLSGLVIVGFDAPTAGAPGNLLILQAPRQAGSFNCATTAACHGRYITGVTPSGSTSNGRFFEVTTGTLTITSLDGGRLKGTFSGTLRSSDGAADNTFTIGNGTIDVPFLTNATTDGSLMCMLSAVGMTNASCQTT